jgi:hypothetical protein
MNGTLGAAIEVGGGTPSSPNNQHSLRFKVGRDNQDNKAGIERMRIDSNGNVGIGTTSPDSELHVNDGDSASQIYITSSDNSLAGLYLGDQTRGFRGGVIYNNSTDSLGLWGYAATGFTAQRMTIDSAGNVLVGGSSQSGTANKVMVKSADKFGLSIIDTTAQAIGVGGALNLGGNYRTSGDAQAFTRIAALKDNSADGNFAYSMGFYTTPNGGTFTERMRIDSSGNVGVGTTNPDAKLHVEGHMISSSHKSGLMYTVANSSAYQASQTISVTLPSIAEGNTYHYTVTRHKGAGNRQISTGYISFNGQAGGGIHPLVNTGVADVVISGNTVSVTNNTELAVLKMTFLRVA